MLAHAVTVSLAGVTLPSVRDQAALGVRPGNPGHAHGQGIAIDEFYHDRELSVRHISCSFSVATEISRDKVCLMSRQRIPEHGFPMSRQCHGHGSACALGDSVFGACNMAHPKRLGSLSLATERA